MLGDVHPPFPVVHVGELDLRLHHGIVAEDGSFHVNYCRIQTLNWYSSTSGLVGKWLYDHYLKLVPGWVTATVRVLLLV